MSIVERMEALRKMIIDAKTGDHLSKNRQGMAGFISWKRLAELMREHELESDEDLLALEIGHHGITYRVAFPPHEERGKHPLQDKQV